MASILNPESPLRPPFEASRGDRPYIFVSYAHADAARVYDELVWLKGRGYDIWYDEGISPGHDWPEELASAIEGCVLFLLFVTPRSVASENCSRETTFAMTRGRPFLAVHLEQTTLPRGLELSIGNSQAILKYASDEESYRRKLDKAVADCVGLDAKPAPGRAGPAAQSSTPRKRTALVASALAIAIGAIAIFVLREPGRSDTAPDLAKLRQMVTDRGAIIGISDFSTLEPYLLARKLAASDEPPEALEQLWEPISVTGIARTSPDAVTMSLKRAMSDATWVDIGVSGAQQLRFPRGQFFWRFEKPGYQTKVIYGDAAFLFPAGIADGFGSTIYLSEESGPASERVPKQKLLPGSVNYITLPFKEVPSFKVARYEVTNREYKEFVDGGGYANRAYFAELGNDFLEAREGFVDRTGRPGPATWEVGTYPSGEAELPVGGVSWYEAMAYARFRGARLPTIYHWAQAALPFYASSLARISNFNSSGAQPVTSTLPGPNGAYGMYGNVREWVANAWGERRWILGGGWSDPEYLSALPFSLPPTDRSAVNGIRLYDLDEPYPAEFDGPFKPSFNDYRTIKPVSDETYAAIADQYVDVGEPIRAEAVSTKDEAEWVHEVVRLNSDIAGESFDLHLFLPKGRPGPFQVVTYFPPIDAFWAKGDGDSSVKLQGGYVPLDIIPRGGRALVWPIYYGSFERYAGIYDMTATRRAQLQTEMRVHWYADLKRSLDYLATRTDLDVGRLAYLGYSYGASHALPLLALEKRYDAAILVAGGLGNLGIDPMPQAADPLNFISRITTPVMMVNGKKDFVFPLESSQKPLFDLLGSAPKDKLKIEYDGDHYQIPATPVTRDIANWLDARLGPTTSAGN